MKKNTAPRHYGRRSNPVCTGFLAVLFICMICVIVLSVTVPAAANESAAAAQKDPACKYYKSILIEKGDTLWTIAERYISEEYASKTNYIEEVKHMNNLRTDEIHAGNYLVIPYYDDAPHE